MYKRLPALIALLIMLTSCMPSDLLTIAVPSSKFMVKRDIAYKDGKSHILDIYEPVTPAAGRPVAVFFFGGEWRFGSKEQVRFVAEPLAAAGVTVVVPDYRLSPEVTFPAFIDDGAVAVSWTHQHIAEYGGDPGNIFVMGHSAGAYIAVMLAVNPEYLAHAGMNRSDLAGAIGLAGPYNFLPITWPELKPIFNVVTDMNVTQPITFVDGKNPPMLLAAGMADTTVNPSQNTDTLYHKIMDDHGTVSERLYPDLGHVGIIVAFAPLLRGKAPVFYDTLSFIKTNSRYTK